MTYLDSFFRGGKVTRRNLPRENPDLMARRAALRDKKLEVGTHVVIGGINGVRKISHIDQVAGTVSIKNSMNQEVSYDPRRVTPVQVRQK